MKTEIIKRTYATVILLAVLLCCTCNKAEAAGKAVATIVSEHGQVLLERSGAAQFVTAKIPEQLFYGDRISTSGDGDAAILFSDGSELKLNANTSIRVTSSANSSGPQNMFQALVGMFWAHMHPGDVIQTPSANLVVRGTEVLVNILADGDVVCTCTEGNIYVYNQYGSVDLTTNEQTTVIPGHAPSVPITVDGASLTQWTQDISLEPDSAPFTFLNPVTDTFLTLSPVALKSFFNDSNGNGGGGAPSSPNKVQAAPELAVSIMWPIGALFLVCLSLIRRHHARRKTF